MPADLDTEKVVTPSSNNSIKPITNNNDNDLETDPNIKIISFAEIDPSNPQQWPSTTKYAITVLLSFAVFLMPLSSAIVAPTLPELQSSLDISSRLEAVLVMTSFLLTYCIGPLLWGPLSELWGRVSVLHVGNGIYLIFNLVCGFAQTEAQIVIFRVFAGLGGAASLVVGAGIITDLFPASRRGTIIALYNIGPTFGPSLGAVVGGFIVQYTTWRWAFWSTSIFAAIFLIAGLLIMRETYPPIILQQRKKKLMKTLQQHDPTIYKTSYEVKSPNGPKSLAELYRTSLLRPFLLLRNQPIVQLLAVFYAYLYGIMYLVLSTFTTLWTSKYNMPIGTGSLNYLALGTGYFLGSQVCALAADRIYQRLKARSPEGQAKPEYRVILMFPASIVAPIGLLWYGWTAEAQLPWIVPDMGIALFACGAMISFQCTTGYLYEAFTLYAASATGAVYILRGLTGFGFPLFGPAMYEALGYGWGNTVVAMIAVVLGVPAPVILWRYGELLRRRSDYAVG